MIIQVRGTSGSGKSTVIRRVMEKTNDWQDINITGRTKPLYYISQELNVALLGHYESACGGCDNVGSAAKVFDLIKEIQSKPVTKHRTILCEGLLLSEDTKWSQQLDNLHVVYLNTPLNTCLKQIRARREAAGNDKPLNPSNTVNRVAVIERSRQKLTDLGVSCYHLPFDAAVKKVLELITNA